MEDNYYTLKYIVDEAISSVGFGKFQLLGLAYSGLGMTSSSMEVLLLSLIGPAVQSLWKLSPAQESLLSTAVFVGLIFGSYIWGLVSNSHGRRKSILGSVMVTVTVGILSAFSPNYIWLVILRCLIGFGTGAANSFALWFLEFIPTHNRGKWMMVHFCFWTFGSISVTLLGWIVMPRLGWRWLMGFSALPSLAILLISVFIPESPRYLCVQGKTMEAQGILMKVAEMNQTERPPGTLIISSDHDQRTMELILDQEPPLMEKSPLLSSSSSHGEIRKTNLSSMLTLFSPDLIRITLSLWFSFFSGTFLYYGVILFISKLNLGKSTCRRTLTEIPNFTDNGNNIYFNLLINSCSEIPGIICAAILLDKIGRKLFMGITSVLVLVVLLPLVSPQNNETMTTALLFCARMCIQTNMAVLSTYAIEVYPTSLRSVGVGMAGGMGTIGAMVSPVVAVGLVGSCHQTAAIILFEVMALLLGFGVLLFPFNTKGRKLTDTMLDHHQENIESLNK